MQIVGYLKEIKDENDCNLYGKCSCVFMSVCVCVCVCTRACICVFKSACARTRVKYYEHDSVKPSLKFNLLLFYVIEN